MRPPDSTSRLHGIIDSTVLVLMWWGALYDIQYLWVIRLSAHVDGHSSPRSIGDLLSSIPNTSGLSSTMQLGSTSPQLDTPSITNTATLFETLSTNALAIIVKLIYGRLAENVYEHPSNYYEPKTDTVKRCEQVRLLGLLFC